MSTKECERCCAFTKGPGHEDEITNPGAGAPAQVRAFDTPEKCNVDGDETAPRRIAPDDFDSVAPAGASNACVEIFEKCGGGMPWKDKGDYRIPRKAAAGCNVTDVHFDRFLADLARGHIIGGEMVALDKNVCREQQEVFPVRYNSAVITDGDGSRCGRLDKCNEFPEKREVVAETSGSLFGRFWCHGFGCRVLPFFRLSAA